MSSEDKDPKTSGRKSRFHKPAAVDIIRKKNLRELADDSAALRVRLEKVKSNHERSVSDVSMLEAELALLRADVAKTRAS